MTTKALVIIDQDVTVKDLCDQVQASIQAAKERIKFLEKQATDIKKEHEEVSKAVWDKLEAYLTQAGILPKEYSEKTHSLTFGEAGVLMMVEKNDMCNSVADVIKKLFT